MIALTRRFHVVSTARSRSGSTQGQHGQNSWCCRRCALVVTRLICFWQVCFPSIRCDHHQGRCWKPRNNKRSQRSFSFRELSSGSCCFNKQETYSPRRIIFCQAPKSKNLLRVIYCSHCVVVELGVERNVLPEQNPETDWLWLRDCSSSGWHELAEKWNLHQRCSAQNQPDPAENEQSLIQFAYPASECTNMVQQGALCCLDNWQWVKSATMQLKLHRMVRSSSCNWNGSLFWSQNNTRPSISRLLCSANSSQQNPVSPNTIIPCQQETGRMKNKTTDSKRLAFVPVNQERERLGYQSLSMFLCPNSPW